MVRVAEYVRKKVIVHVGDQLKQCGIVGGVQAEPDSTSHRCFKMLFIRHISTSVWPKWRFVTYYRPQSTCYRRHDYVDHIIAVLEVGY